MRLSRVVLQSSTFNPAKDSSELMLASREFEEPEFDIQLQGGLLIITHPATGVQGIYPQGKMDYGRTQVPVVKAVEPNTAPTPIKRKR